MKIQVIVLIQKFKLREPNPYVNIPNPTMHGVPKTDQPNLQNITRERSDAKPPMQVELSPSHGHRHTLFSLQYENTWRIHD